METVWLSKQLERVLRREESGVACGQAGALSLRLVHPEARTFSGQSSVAQAAE